MLDMPLSPAATAPLDTQLPLPFFPCPTRPPQQLDLRFTGSGSEYFRIWIVNLMLTVVTLGVYSAWAKVRRLQYFNRNTELDGAVFDFTGNPKAILRGRCIAAALVGAYQYAVGFSWNAGFVAGMLLLMALPFMARGALRFRLAHTRYRGLRFQFTGSVAGAYCAFLLLGVLLLPVLRARMEPAVLAVLPTFYLLWPLIHCLMKRYQHGNVSFASLPSTIALPRGAYYWPHLALIVLGILALVLGSLLGAFGYLLGALAEMISGRDVLGPLGAIAILLFIGAYCAWPLIGWAYIIVCNTNRTWSSTSFPGLTIASTMTVMGYFKLQAVNILLTVMSVGFYRPFAVVRTYEYRLAHLKVTAEDSFQRVLAHTTSHHGSASGDGMTDFFHLDISW